MTNRIVQAINRLIRRRLRSRTSSRRSALKIYQSFFDFPLPLAVQRNALTVLPQIRNTLVLAAVEGTSVDQAAAVVTRLDPDTSCYHLNKVQLPALQEALYEELLEKLLALKAARKLPTATSSRRRRHGSSNKCMLAIDTTDYRYWGKQVENSFVIQCPTGFVYRYSKLSIVAHQVALPLALLPVSQLDTKEQLLERLFELAKPLGLAIGTIFLDRGFYSAAVAEWLLARKLPFVIGARKSSRIK